jgi:hypothetical protein
LCRTQQLKAKGKVVVRRRLARKPNCRRFSCRDEACSLQYCGETGSQKKKAEQFMVFTPGSSTCNEVRIWRLQG